MYSPWLLACFHLRRSRPLPRRRRARRRYRRKGKSPEPCRSFCNCRARVNTSRSSMASSVRALPSPRVPHEVRISQFDVCAPLTFPNIDLPTYFSFTEESLLRKRIMQLQEWRKMGIKTLIEGEVYEKEKARYAMPSSYALSFLGDLCAFCRSSVWTGAKQKRAE